MCVNMCNIRCRYSCTVLRCYADHRGIVAAVGQWRRNELYFRYAAERSKFTAQALICGHTSDEC